MRSPKSFLDAPECQGGDTKKNREKHLKLLAKCSQAFSLTCERNQGQLRSHCRRAGDLTAGLLRSLDGKQLRHVQAGVLAVVGLEGARSTVSAGVGSVHELAGMVVHSNMHILRRR